MVLLLLEGIGGHLGNEGCEGLSWKEHLGGRLGIEVLKALVVTKENEVLEVLKVLEATKEKEALEVAQEKEAV